ncbi:MAG: serpin family protein [Candidatus Thorarchaeota archaeon]
MISSKNSPITEASNKFAFELYNKLAKKRINLFFSPFSISTAIAMIYVGSKEETSKQIEEVMHFTIHKQRLPIEYEKFLTNFFQERVKNKSEFILSNAQWIQHNYQLLENYTYAIETYFKAMLTQVNFLDEQKTMDIINGWVEKSTKGKITNILEKINPESRLLITNSIYFKDKWLKPFDEMKTKEEPFFIAKDKKILVEMMTEKQKYSFRNFPTYQLLEIPYKDDDLSLIIFLPRDIEGLPDLEKKITSININVILNDITSLEVEIFIPKFKFTNAMKLSKELQEMGMKEPFSSTADFSGISQTKLAISEVVHKAFIEVNEEGSEAAAATIVEMVLATGPPKDVERNIFRADHPFMFIIYSRKANLILFIGKVMNPKEE